MVSTMASPKHPQSLIGSVSASHSVSSVMTLISTTRNLETRRLWMAKSRQMPIRNSMAEMVTEAPSVR